MSLINLAQSPDKQRGAARGPRKSAKKNRQQKIFKTKKRTTRSEAAKKQINNKWKASKKKKKKKQKNNIKTICMGTAVCGVFLASLVWLGTVIKQLLIAKLGSRRWHNLLACPTA